MKTQVITIAINILLNFQIKRCNGQGIQSCGKRLVHHQSLIKKGYVSKEGDWPWHAAIYHRENQDIKYKCGGSLINSNSVLTAAHCVHENNRQIIPDRILVELGKFNLKVSGTNTQQLETYKIVPHPDYDQSNLKNDISIIRLATEATFTNYVQPICLWDATNVALSEVEEKLGTVIGWGVAETKEISNVLRHAFIPVVSLTKCLDVNRDFFGAFLYDKNFCAGFRNGTSVCEDDSGGPMFFEQNGVYRIRGIVSLSESILSDNGVDRVCNSKEYAIFTDVAKYLNWIKEIVPELKQSPSKSVNKVEVASKLDYQSTETIFSDDNCYFLEGNFRHIDTRRKDCGRICSTNKVCTHFTWIELGGRGVCFLKNFDSSPVTYREEGSHCGSVQRPDGQRLQFYAFGKIRFNRQCDFNGNDIGNEERSTDMECGLICERRSNCTHFSWSPDRNSYGRGTCMLKGPGLISTPIEKPNLVCGFLVRDLPQEIRILTN